jgi:hypothetical protein
MKTATEKNIDYFKNIASDINNTESKRIVTTKSETDLWLDYLIDLDPEDETGAFLTPEDLVEIDHAYLRLQTYGSGVPTNPNDNNKVAANADDEFIKKKIALALQRAIPNQPFSRVNSQTSNIWNSNYLSSQPYFNEGNYSKKNIRPRPNKSIFQKLKLFVKQMEISILKVLLPFIRSALPFRMQKNKSFIKPRETESVDKKLQTPKVVPVKIQPVPEAKKIEPPKPVNGFRVISYRKGMLSGKCKVMFPKSPPKYRHFDKEVGWNTTVEITRNGKVTTENIFARGCCMNVLFSTVWELQNGNSADLVIDSPSISFEPIQVTQEDVDGARYDGDRAKLIYLSGFHKTNEPNGNSG